MKASRIFFTLCALSLAVSAFSSCGIDEEAVNNEGSEKAIAENVENETNEIVKNADLPNALKEVLMPLETTETAISDGPYIKIQQYLEANDMISSSQESFELDENTDKIVEFDDYKQKASLYIEALTQDENNLLFQTPRYEAILQGKEIEDRITIAEVKEFIDESNLTGEELEKAILNLISERNKYPDISKGSGIYHTEYFLDDEGKYYIIDLGGIAYYRYYIDSEKEYGASTLSEIGTFGEDGT